MLSLGRRGWALENKSSGNAAGREGPCWDLPATKELWTKNLFLSTGGMVAPWGHKNELISSVVQTGELILLSFYISVEFNLNVKYPTEIPLNLTNRTGKNQRFDNILFARARKLALWSTEERGSAEWHFGCVYGYKIPLEGILTISLEV